MKKSEYPLIKDWKELSEIPNESNTHILEVDVEGGSGWLKAKEPKKYNNKLSYMRNIRHQDVYLSTHTFYGLNYKQSTKILHACGFDVEIDNWDKDQMYLYGKKK